MIDLSVQLSGVHIGFSTPKTWNPLSWLIRKMLKSNISHMWLVYWDLDFQAYYVMQAARNAFILQSFENFKKDNIICDIITPKIDISEGFRKISKELSSNYDIKGLFGMFLVELSKRFIRRIKNPFKSEHNMFCTEVISRAMFYSNYPGITKENIESLSPIDIRNILQN